MICLMFIDCSDRIFVRLFYFCLVDGLDKEVELEIEFWIVLGESLMFNDVFVGFYEFDGEEVVEIGLQYGSKLGIEDVEFLVVFVRFGEDWVIEVEVIVEFCCFLDLGFCLVRGMLKVYCFCEV